jgi:hypothetical protein
MSASNGEPGPEPNANYIPLRDFVAAQQIHNEALRAADKEFAQERDRRYSEVNIEREKALKIKETADLAALSLAREIQTYEDEKANELREQINRERNLYASKEDLANLSEKFTLSGGKHVGSAEAQTRIFAGAASVAAVIGIAINFLH